jgi:hypothetical protein
MKTRKLFRYLPIALAALAFLLLPLAVFAAAVIPADGSSIVATGNAAADSILTWLTPVIVPIVLLGVKKILPRIPSGLIPILAPVLGILIDLVNTYGLNHSSNLMIAAVAGLAGVGLREVKEAVKPAPNGGWPKNANDGAPAV